MSCQRVMVAGLAAGALVVGTLAAPAAAQPDEDYKQRIAAALPAKAYAAPKSPRKLLVFTLTRGFRHSSIPVGVEALSQMGRQTGAFEVVASEDPTVFEPQSLARFDAVLLLSTTGELFAAVDPDALTAEEKAAALAREAQLKKSLLDFVNAGKGLIGIHAATDCCYQWAEFGRMIGGYFDGHPWHERVTIHVEEPRHPLAQMFESGTFVVTDEIYQLRDPYSRERQRVLLSLDTDDTDMNKQGIRRTDGDFAVTWVRKQGAGRVFYCSLGHREEIFWNPVVLRHYLAGIQYALGDLEADAQPRPRGGATPQSASGQESPEPKPSAEGWTPLFNGEDLTGWKGLVADPPTRARMSADELHAAQAVADENMRAHWSVQDGVLVLDGHGQNLCTAKDYGDFELMADWKIDAGGDSGIYLRGSPQVQIWDPARWPEGSGGLYNNERGPSRPIVRADHPVGAWNTFRIRMIGDVVSVWLNGQLVVDGVPLENYWERGKPLYAKGPIELQSHNSPLYFRNIRIREISPAEAERLRPKAAWRELFNGRDLSGWTCPEGSWVVEDGVLVRKGGGDVWSQEQFGDFVLDLEFKVGKGANSGIFFRTSDLNDYVQSGIELQVFDSFGKSAPGRHDCGAIFDCLAPRINAALEAGEWNHVVLRCQGSRVWAAMNGEPIIDMNLDAWTQPHRNPDGTDNKFATAYKDMARKGHIGLQDHGDPVWYRKIRILPLDRMQGGETD